MFVSVCCDGLCFVCALVRRWAITGTLDAVRNLTGLTVLSLFQNIIGGMFVCITDGIGAVVVVLSCGRQWCVVSRLHRLEILRLRITSHCVVVWMI